jgi:hypothetical protein
MIRTDGMSLSLGVNSSIMLQKISGKELVVDRIVEQIVGPKINSALLPEVSI